jgi:hypothetical protein
VLERVPAVARALSAWAAGAKTSAERTTETSHRAIAIGRVARCGP